MRNQSRKFERDNFIDKMSNLSSYYSVIFNKLLVTKKVRDISISNICADSIKKVLEISDEIDNKGIDFWNDLEIKDELLFDIYNNAIKGIEVLNGILNNDLNSKIDDYNNLLSYINNYDYKEKYVELLKNKIIKTPSNIVNYGFYNHCYFDARDQAEKLEIKDRRIYDQELINLVHSKELEIQNNEVPSLKREY